jgi:mono/diheme cytochrome c family protein
MPKQPREQSMRIAIGRSYARLAIAVLAMLAGNAAVAQEIYAGKFPQQTGEDLFRNICQGCHMPDAKGAIGAGAYPALAANPRLGVAVYPITVVLHGQRAMPPFGESLDDQQVANVINYVRSHFGNHYKDQITAAAVTAHR